FDRSIAPSHAMAKILRDNGWPVTDVLPFGVPDVERSCEPAETPLIAYAGRLTEEKGVGWLLDGVAKAGPALRGATVEILGDGPSRPALETQAHRLGIADRVVFHGKLSRTESQQVLGRAWVQVIPSLWAEPFGLVTAESLIRGTPVIVTDQGAPSEMVDDGRTGWVVPVGDVGAMAERLIDATRDRDQMLRMGAVASAGAKIRYDVDTWIDSYLGILGEMLTPKEGSGAEATHLRSALGGQAAG
ncbi:MAG: glycosyltransferase family 4 protein, partial [Pseudomonadota bacterium]